MKRLALILMVLLLLPAAGFAQTGSQRGDSSVVTIHLPEVPVTLKEGKGRDLVGRYCAICHSVGYIPMQPGFSQERWAGIVHKMIKVYGAPVPQQDAARIIEYLGAQYGPEKSGVGGQ
jgi:cytochrome c5